MPEVFTQQIGYGLWLYGYETEQVTGQTRAMIVNAADSTVIPNLAIVDRASSQLLDRFGANILSRV